jgi:hypothetical protein
VRAPAERILLPSLTNHELFFVYKTNEEKIIENNQNVLRGKKRKWAEQDRSRDCDLFVVIGWSVAKLSLGTQTQISTESFLN